MVDGSCSATGNGSSVVNSELRVPRLGSGSNSEGGRSSDGEGIQGENTVFRPLDVSEFAFSLISSEAPAVRPYWCVSVPTLRVGWERRIYPVRDKGGFLRVFKDFTNEMKVFQRPSNLAGGTLMMRANIFRRRAGYRQLELCRCCCLLVYVRD